MTSNPLGVDNMFKRYYEGHFADSTRYGTVGNSDVWIDECDIITSDKLKALWGTFNT